MSNPGSDCPSCGRFVGPYDTCPYCGADVNRRMPVKVFAYGSLLVGVVGVLVLLLVAGRSQVPTVSLGQLSGTMNWAYVRIEGLVIRQPSYDQETGDLNLWLSDGTGEIMVVAYRPEAEVLLSESLVPAMGDRVALEGTLRIKEDFQYLVLNVPQHTVVQQIPAVEMAIGNVDGATLYRKVTLQGMIRDDRTPYEGLRLLSIRDTTGEIDVALSSDTNMLGGDWPSVIVGQVVQVTGAVDRYEDKFQLSVGRVNDVVPLQESIAIAPMSRLGDISLDNVGDLVSAKGTVSSVDPFSAGVRLVLNDGSGEVAVVLWQDLYGALDERDHLVKGSEIEVQGEVAEYKGELEIVPEFPFDLAIMVAATPPASEERTDQQPDSDSKQVIGVVIPTSTLVPTPTATGMISPTVDITDTPVPSPTPRPTSQPTPSPTPPARPTPETRAIGAITGKDVGSWLAIERAGVSEMIYFSKGVQYRLTDSTGSITLLMWQDVLEESSDRYDLLPGSQVRVAGAIDEYQGELEIVPRTDADVRVIVPADRLPVEQRPIRDITPSDEGRIFTVDGTVTKIEGSSWLRIWIQDGTGQTLIYVPERVLEYLPAGIGVGVRLRVTGEVDIYRGELEIIPLAAADVEVR
jgi:DNA/RNA endonuclease YhcR with UshA esterase domain